MKMSFFIDVPIQFSRSSIQFCFISVERMAPIIERVVENIELGEGPHWDIATQSLYFVDIFSKTINKYNPATKKHTKAHFGKKI